MSSSAEEVREGSSASRLAFWQVAVKMIPEWPHGGGLDTFNLASQSHVPEKFRGINTYGRSVHSVWFEVILELGWLGGVIYVLLLSSYRSAYGRIRGRPGANDATRLLGSALLTSMIVCLVAFTFLDSMRQEIFFWLCSMLVALDLQLRDQDLSPVATTPTLPSAPPARRRSRYWRDTGGSN